MREREREREGGKQEKKIEPRPHLLFRIARRSGGASAVEELIVQSWR